MRRALLAVVTIGAWILTPSSATADEHDPPAEVSQVLRGDRLEAAPETAATRRAEVEFVAESAAEGLLYDSAEVDSAVVGGVTTVWSDAVDLSKVVVDRQEDDGADDVVGIGAVAENDPDPTDQTLARMGSSSVSSPYGYLRSAGGTVQVTVQGFKLISGWERFQLREDAADRNVFYYGHWATAVGKSVTGFDPAPYVVDVRSRPKVGYRNTFLQLRNYWPKKTEKNCNTEAEIGVNVGLFHATLPMQNCNSLSPDPDANAISMKVVWSAGACKDSTVEGADLAMAVDTVPSAKGVLSDYSYARFDAAGPVGASKCNINSSNDVRAIYADPGWS